MYVSLSLTPTLSHKIGEMGQRISCTRAEGTISPTAGGENSAIMFWIGKRPPPPWVGGEERGEGAYACQDKYNPFLWLDVSRKCVEMCSVLNRLLA
jgi:hypothetical protein